MTPTTMALNLLRASDAAQWQRWLARVRHDFYHTAAYHCLSEQQGEGRAFLAVYREQGRLLLWPYLLRPIEGPGAAGLYDVGSVYGYPGPLGLDCDGDPAFLTRAHHALVEIWRSQGVVAAFTRLHGVLQNQRFLPPSAPAELRGQTVSIDLTRAPDQIWSGYRRSLRYDVNRARQNGVWVESDPKGCHLERFTALYQATMRRNGAPPSYFFDLTYFRRLLAHLGPRAELLLVRWQHQVIGGGIFVESNGMVHNHFCVNDPQFLALSPSKVLLDEVRRRAQHKGLQVFHLGGGRGALPDSLFHFKAAFSKTRHDFYIWKAVIEPEAYRELCALHGANDGGDRNGPSNGRYFPAYRRPRGAANKTAARAAPFSV